MLFPTFDQFITEQLFNNKNKSVLTSADGKSKLTFKVNKPLDTTSGDQNFGQFTVSFTTSDPNNFTKTYLELINQVPTYKQYLQEKTNDWFMQTSTKKEKTNSNQLSATYTYTATRKKQMTGEDKGTQLYKQETPFQVDSRELGKWKYTGPAKVEEPTSNVKPPSLEEPSVDKQPEATAVDTKVEATPQSTVIIKTGSKGPNVKELQALIATALKQEPNVAFPKYGIDGAFGNETKAALTKLKLNTDNLTEDDITKIKELAGNPSSEELATVIAKGAVAKPQSTSTTKPNAINNKPASTTTSSAVSGVPIT